MKKGDALYTSMLKEDGTVLDDSVMFCREDDKFWITTLFIEILKEWFTKHIGDKDVSFKDLTPEKIMYAIQGPKSKDVMDAILKDNIDDLKTFEYIDTKVNDIDIMVCRTGFTGELGYEIHFNPKHQDEIVKELKEKGYIISDDFEGANPVELGLGWRVDCDKDFIGKEKTCDLKKNGPNRNLLGFTVKDGDAKVEKDNKVKLDGKEIGKVTGYTYGFTVEEYIVYAMVDSKAKEEDKVTIVTTDGEVDANLQERVFYDPKGERLKG